MLKSEQSRREGPTVFSIEESTAEERGGGGGGREGGGDKWLVWETGLLSLLGGATSSQEAVRGGGSHSQLILVPAPPRTK